MVYWCHFVMAQYLLFASNRVSSETTSNDSKQLTVSLRTDIEKSFQQVMHVLNADEKSSVKDIRGIFQQLISSNGGISNLMDMITSQLLDDKCARDGVELLKDLTSLKMWALQMIDASGKPSRNLLQGNNIWFGSYDDCLKIHHTVPGNTGHVIDGAYARIKIPVPPNITTMFNAGLRVFGESSTYLRWDLCVPKSCSSEQITSMFNITQLRSLGLSVASVDFVGPKSFEGDTAAFVSMAILGCFVLLCIIGTLWNVIQDRYVISSKSAENYHQNSLKENGYLNEGTVLNGVAELSTDGDWKVKHGMNNITSGGHREPKKISQSNGISEPIDNSQPNGIPQPATSKPKHRTSTLSRILLAFSVGENGRKLLNCSSPPGSLGCLNGIRVLSMAWVILGHCIRLLIEHIENKSDLWNMSKTFWFQFIPNGSLSVDTFFFLSGLLVSYLFIREVQKTGKISVKQMGLFYFHRIWRLTPLYMIVIMMYTNLTKYFVEGPMENRVIHEEGCRRYWWTNLLYINNVYDFGQQGMCMGWSWYLANDMQFFVLSPVVLIPLALGYRVIGLLVILCMVASQIISSGYIGWDIGNPTLETQHGARFFNEVYIQPYVRIGVYAIGLLLGYVINRTKGKLHIPRVVLFVGTLVAGTAGLLVNYLTYDQFIGDHTIWGSDSNIAFQTVFRPVWALALFWLVFVCVHGYGGFVNTLLSWEAWIPLSRLTYAAYLIHLIVLAVFLGNMSGYGYLTGFYIMNNYIGIFAITYAVSFIISVVVEAPFLALEKIIFQR